ncbi:hypothetical protein FIBSPDRAFT_699202, partial [Athelia psychrophila]
LSDVIAFVYTGSVRPTEVDLRRTPMLVRRHKVATALEWLKLNHDDYSDLNISYTNLEEYPIDGCPFMIGWKKQEAVREAAAMASHEQETEEGAEHGPCPLIINGMVGGDLGTKPWNELTALAVKHLKDGNVMMALGHKPEPQSLYHNVQMYPQMF